MTLNKYLVASATEKIILAHVEPIRRLVVWTNHSGSVYKKSVSDIPVAVREDGVLLTEVGAIPTGSGEWYFDRATFELYVWASDSNDPSDSFTAVSFRLLLSSKPINLPLDIDSGDTVPYEGVIKGVSPFKQQLDDQQRGITLESTGSIDLINDINLFTTRFDKYIWEDQPIRIWLHSPELGIANRVKLFDGRVVTKQWSQDSIKIGFRDFSFELRDRINTPLLDGTESLTSGGSVNLTKDQFLIPKRRIYGRVDGLWLECLDNEGEGSNLSGTYAGTASTRLITATSGSVHTQLSVGDKLTIANTDFTVDTFSKLDVGLTEGEVSITNNGSDITLAGAGSTTLSFSDVSVNDKIIITLAGFDSDEKGIYNVDAKTTTTATLSKVVGSLPSTGTYQAKSAELFAVKEGLPTSFYVTDELTFGFSGQDVTVVSDTPRRDTHREWLVAHHECYQPNYTITGVNTGAKAISLSNAMGLFTGDKVVIDGVLKTVDSINVNTITIVETIPAVSTLSTFTKSPVQSLVFDGQSLVETVAFTVNQTEGDCRVVLEQDAEFSGSIPETQIRQSITVTNGSNVVYSGTNLFADYRARDWFTIDGGTDWYEILEIISPNCVTIRSTISESSATYSTIKTRRPTYLKDSSKLICNTYGKTVNGDKTGDLIINAAQVVKDILRETTVTVNTASFDAAELDAKSLISLPIPTRRRAEHPDRRAVISLVNQSVQGSLTNNINFEAEYHVFNTGRDSSVVKRIEQSDLIGMVNVNVDSKFQLSKLDVIYRTQDYNTDNNIESTSEKLEVENTDFNNQNRVTQSSEIEVFLYYQADADAFARRLLLMRSTARKTFTLNASNFLIDVELNDIIEMRIPNLYQRFGGDSSDRRLGIVSGLRQSGGKTTIVVEELGSIFTRTGTITDNSANEYSSATVDEKLYNAYITDNNGVTDNKEDTIGINLIQ